MMKRLVVFLSLLLLYFTVPHTLEDFATGEPAQAGVPVVVLSLVLSTLIMLQAAGLYWIGQNKRRGLLIQAGVGLFWPVAAGAAQLPTILSGEPYRSGFISVLYVLGIIVVGVLLLISALLAWRQAQR